MWHTRPGAGRTATNRSPAKVAAELKALGYRKWKSCGLIRYRNLQLAAQWKPLLLDPAASHPPIVRLFAILVGQDLP